MNILPLNHSDIFSISNLAKIVWPVAYGQILSKQQLVYMLNAFYNNEALLDQMSKQHLFYGVKEGEELVAFIAIELNHPKIKLTKIHKLYVLPNQQGKQLGSRLINFVTVLARNKNQTKLVLNVNRYNAAKDFYAKQGFVVTKQEDIEIGQGYLMEDFVMEKEI